MNITIYIDEPSGWFAPWAKKLEDALSQKHRVTTCYALENIGPGDIAFYLSCYRIVSQEILDLHQHNLVCHPSDLPKGRGMSPLTWEILAGNNAITLTLFEAVAALDAGVIYYQTTLNFQGHELNDELKHTQGQKTIELCLQFMNDYPNIQGREQVGDPTFYRRRKPEDSALDINKTIAEQFNLLRVVDNERYPAYFEYAGHRYILRIEKKVTD